MPHVYKPLLSSLVLLIALLLLPSAVLATIQFPDKIVFEGKKYELCNSPIGDYFTRFPDRQPKIVVRNTGLYRGYIATFDFDIGNMFLKDIEAYKEIISRPSGATYTSWQSVLTEVVPGKERLSIDWFSGLLILPNGYSRQLGYDEYFCELRYEAYMLLEIDNGKFIRSKKFASFEDWTTFQQKQYEAFKKTPAYKDVFKELSVSGRSEEKTNEIIRDSILDRSKKILVD